MEIQQTLKFQDVMAHCQQYESTQNPNFDH